METNISNPEDRMNFIANSIAKAKKVIQKFESGSFSRGHINEDELFTQPVEQIGQPQVVTNYNESYNEKPIYDSFEEPETVVSEPLRNIDNSRMSSAILESFRKNPPSAAGMKAMNTSNPLASNNFKMDQLAAAVPGAKKQQQRPQQPQQQQPANYGYSRQPVNEQQQYVPPQQVLSEDYVKFLIQKTVEETMEKTIKAVLAEINKPTTIDENIQIKIGNKLFGGKIITLKG